MKPYLVNRIEKDGIPYREFSSTVLDENICSSSTAKAARLSMEAVITEGTGRNAFKNMPFAVAGKTGTAHVADGSIKYNDMVYQASFAGYFPANDPQYSCIVVIRTKPHAALHYGGQLAAPVFREIATRLYAMYVNRKTAPVYELKKDSSVYYYTGNTNDVKNVYNTLNVVYNDSVKQANWSSVYASNFQPVLKERIINSILMPDIKGMGLKDAIYLLENMGLKVQTKGKGKVMVQSILAGTTLAKGMTVYVELG
jgi:cell division protein FtsI (penicillin-binding protein 3)